MSDGEASVMGFRAWRPIVAWAALAVALCAWWIALAPTWIGGSATYVLVEGSSMEPMLHTGDVVVARRQSTYQVGNLVVINVYGGHVIHRLVARAPDGTWVTRGDNNGYDDPWVVSSENIAGSYWLLVPALGPLVTWTLVNPVQFGLACAAACLLFFLPWRRRRYAPALSEALAGAVREPPPQTRSPLESGVLWICGVAAIVALALLGMLGATRQLLSVQGLVAVSALLWAGGFALYSAHRLYDGRGMPEPTRSEYALSGRLWQVAELPALDPAPAPVRSALAMRKIAEKYRMPVLHRIDANSESQEFLLVTVQRGAFVWRPMSEGVSALPDPVTGRRSPA